MASAVKFRQTERSARRDLAKISAIDDNVCRLKQWGRRLSLQPTEMLTNVLNC